MESSSSKLSHKEWRRVAKRERRRRLRRKAAQERADDDQRLRATLERSADYLNWLKEEKEREKAREEKEQLERVEREKLWLEEEVKAQREWKIQQEEKAKIRQQELEKQERIRREQQVKQEAIRKRREEEKRRREEENRRRIELQNKMDDYIDNGIETPEDLRESIDSQPGKELCPFFTKTGACRYGDSCSRNHRRVCLSHVILLPGFYAHFSLEKNSAEYDTDISLEFESSETRQHFLEFYRDVVPELESYGRIKTLNFCCNTEIHLRGNLYVEYYSKRNAARALRSLRGRWYGGRQLNCEFANLQSWRSAVCGMSKCPKGRACNFLHTFKNPNNEYGIKSPPRWAKGGQESNSRRSEHRSRSKWDESIRSEGDESRNWRWSESPEIELEPRPPDVEKRHHRSDDSNRRRRSRRDDSERSRSKSSTHSESRRSFSSRYKKRSNEHVKDDDSSEDERDSSRMRDVKFRRRRRESNGESREDSKDSDQKHRHSRSSNGRSHRHERERDRRRFESRSRSDDRESTYKLSFIEDDNSTRRKAERIRMERDQDKCNVKREEVNRRSTKWDRRTNDSPEKYQHPTDNNSWTLSNDNTEEELLLPRSRSDSEGRGTDYEWATTDSQSDDDTALSWREDS